MDSNQFHYVYENPWPEEKNIKGNHVFSQDGAAIAIAIRDSFAFVFTRRRASSLN